jgi:hypothetical protein
MIYPHANALSGVIPLLFFFLLEVKKIEEFYILYPLIFRPIIVLLGPLSFLPPVLAQEVFH